ncbi:MAG TPA: hypothetical protein VK558_00475, partial [Patescibacteria group bacterium]|nr:hypothetical protein [Patescibacteria group bacterium]
LETAAKLYGRAGHLRGDADISFELGRLEATRGDKARAHHHFSRAAELYHRAEASELHHKALKEAQAVAAG